MADLAEIWVPESQNNSKKNGTNFTRGHMGQIPVIRCFAQKFYMVAYVTKAGLGPEPEFALLCGHSLGGRGLSYGATPICPACNVYSFGGGVGIVVLADSRRQVLPGRASFNSDKVFEDAKILVAVFMICIIIFLLPCQWKYWHRAKNRLRDKTGFGMYNPQNGKKSGFGQSVCVSVCLSVCLSGRLSVLLSLFPRALTGVRFNRSS